MQLLCLYGARKSKPRLKSELCKQQYTVTLFDWSYLAHVRHVVLWQMQNFMCYSKLLCFILNLKAISEYKPPGACIWRGDLSEGFLHYEFGVLIFGGAYFRNFMVTNQASYCRLKTFAGYYSLFTIKIIIIIIIILKCYFSLYARTFKYVFLHVYVL